MPSTLADDDLEKIVVALEHYAAYLVSQQRDNEPYLELIARLTSKRPASGR